MKKTNQNKNKISVGIKILFIAVLMLASALLISAGDIIFKAGSLDISQDLAVSNKLGIGTSSPSVNLHIKGSVPSIRLEDTDWQDWDIKATHGGGTARLDILRSGGTVNVMSLVELSGGGKMGVGTSSPEATLHLKQASGTTGIRMENDWQNWDIVTSRGNLYFQRAGGTVTEMTLVEGGKLGIGTTSPTEMLTLGAGGNIKLNDGNAVVWGTGSGGTEFQTGNGAAHTLSWYTNVTLRMRVDGNGNVGIGTASPAEKLHVNGNVKAKQFITGDITFNKNDKPVWRMFEDENGLYVESLTTGKNYRVVLEEMK